MTVRDELDRLEGTIERALPDLDELLVRDLVRLDPELQEILLVFMRARWSS